jgi:hypothetical protein
MRREKYVSCEAAAAAAAEWITFSSDSASLSSTNVFVPDN